MGGEAEVAVETEGRVEVKLEVMEEGAGAETGGGAGAAPHPPLRLPKGGSVPGTSTDRGRRREQNGRKLNLRL